MEPRLKRISELVDSIETEGMSGLLRTVAIYVDPEGPSAECIQEADNGMDSAVGDEQYYDAALGMASCLREAIIEPEPEEPEEPAEPDPKPDGGEALGDLVLAALLVNMRRQSKI